MTEEHNIIESEENDSEDNSIKKHRSPNYPYIGLEEAIDRANQLQSVAGTHAVRVPTAWETWDYKKGAGNQVVAALDAYKLITVEGIGDRRQVKLTLEARKILDKSSERAELLQVAALSPDLHKDIWEYFKGDLPPDDKVIREYLVYERNFNPNYVNKFIEQFLNTLTFANVSKNDKIDVVNTPEINNDGLGDFVGGKEESGEMNSGAEHKKLLTLPPGRIFKASIEVLENGSLNVIFAGSMDSLTVSLLKDIYDIKEKYEPKMQDISDQISEAQIVGS